VTRYFIFILIIVFLFLGCSAQTGSMERDETIKGYLISPGKLQVDQSLLKKLQDKSYNTIVLDISQMSDKGGLRKLKKKIDTKGFRVYYWIEVGRDIQAASIHPQWLHRPHKLNFYGNKPVVVFPWVSVNNLEVFQYEFEKVNNLLETAGIKDVEGVFLNDIQSAPEGCGCGNALCRMWDNSLGEKVSGEDAHYFGENPVAPLKFVQVVKKSHSNLEVIPVITEECEAGVTVGGVENPETTLGYGQMLCVHPDGLETYPRLIRTLSSLEHVGLLSLYKEFERDDPAYGSEGAWTGAILDRYLSVEPDQRILSILQGWNVTEEEIDAQIEHVISHGAAGYIVAGEKIDQSWIIMDEKEMEGTKI
jgi:hypothetical protein